MVTPAADPHHQRKKSIIPAVGQRQVLADALSRYMGQLGLARRTKSLPSASEILAAEQAEANDKESGNNEQA